MNKTLDLRDLLEDLGKLKRADAFVAALFLVHHEKIVAGSFTRSAVGSVSDVVVSHAASRSAFQLQPQLSRCVYSAPTA